MAAIKPLKPEIMYESYYKELPLTVYYNSICNLLRLKDEIYIKYVYDAYYWLFNYLLQAYKFFQNLHKYPIYG